MQQPRVVYQQEWGWSVATTDELYGTAGNVRLHAWRGIGVGNTTEVLLESPLVFTRVVEPGVRPSEPTGVVFDRGLWESIGKLWIPEVVDPGGEIRRLEEALELERRRVDRTLEALRL